MSSMKKRARDLASGKFATHTVEVHEESPKPKRARRKASAAPELSNPMYEASASKRPVGRPKASKPKSKPQMSTFEVSITVSVGGSDIDTSLLAKVHTFLLEKTLAGKCALERGGIAFHLHLQMVARLQPKYLVAISKLLKSYLGWDTAQPAGGMVMCKKLANKVLHTFHGLLGYCMKDACKDHFQTVDHNVTAADINLGLEQYALHGEEENKNRIVLTMQNIVERIFMWRKFNCTHLLVVDFAKDIFEMFKTGKYYPTASWVIGGYGKGYDPYRMLSLYSIMVRPNEITREDVANVFKQHDVYAQHPITRKQWFAQRWQPEQVSPTTVDIPAGRALFSAVEEMHQNNKKCKKNICAREVSEILAFTPRKTESSLDVLCNVALETPAKQDRLRNSKGKRKVSPEMHLWPEEWNMESQFSTSSSSKKFLSSALAPSEFIPLYTRTDPPLVVL